MKKSFKEKLKKASPWIIGGLAVMGGAAWTVFRNRDNPTVRPTVQLPVAPDDSVEIWEGFVSPVFNKTVASLVLDADFDPYDNIGTQLCFSNDIGANFVVEIIQAG